MKYRGSSIDDDVIKADGKCINLFDKKLYTCSMIDWIQSGDCWPKFWSSFDLSIDSDYGSKVLFRQTRFPLVGYASSWDGDTLHGFQPFDVACELQQYRSLCSMGD